jgi:hypothetical protein
MVLFCRLVKRCRRWRDPERSVRAEGRASVLELDEAKCDSLLSSARVSSLSKARPPTRSTMKPWSRRRCAVEADRVAVTLIGNFDLYRPLTDILPRSSVQPLTKCSLSTRRVPVDSARGASSAPAARGSLIFVLSVRALIRAAGARSTWIQGRASRRRGAGAYGPPCANQLRPKSNPSNEEVAT